MGQLADGGGLADAVDADDQYDRRLCAELQGRIANPQHIDQNLFQRRMDLLAAAQLFFLYPLAQQLHSLAGGLHAHIRQDHALLEFLIKLLVGAGEAVKEATQGGCHGTAGFFQPILDFFKKAQCYSSVIKFKFCSIWFRSRAKILEMPCSCMVTP